MAAYRAVTDQRMVALDKSPGTRPVGISCVWIRRVCKAMLIEAWSDGKEACGSDQLCAGLEAGIEGALHSVRVLGFEEWEVEVTFLRENVEEGRSHIRGRQLRLLLLQVKLLLKLLPNMLRWKLHQRQQILIRVCIV